MQILTSPEDIIKRCLWSDYKRFCLKNMPEEEMNKMIEDNNPIALNEEDAYVIGLLKIVETPNLIHRLKEHIDEVLKIRSDIFNNRLYIMKIVALKEISQFTQRFPDVFKASFEYRKGIDDLKIFSEKIYSDVDNLQTFNFQKKDKTYIYISSNSVKDIVEERNKDK